MKTPLVVAASAAVMLLAAGCSGSSEPNGSKPAATQAAASTKCADLAGKTVDPKASCGDYEEPGSAGCYVNGTQSGSFYYFAEADVTVYGKDGGTWQKGAAGMSMTDMGNALGC